VDTSAFLTPGPGTASDTDAGLSEKKHKKKHKKDKHEESQSTGDVVPDQADASEV